MACIRVRIQSILARGLDTRGLLEEISRAAVELSSGVSEHTVASLELVGIAGVNSIDVLGVELDVEERLRVEAGISMVFVREVGRADVAVEVAYCQGDRSDWEEWSRGFESEVEVIYGTVGPA